MQVLLPESVARNNGMGAAVALDSVNGRLLLLTLDVTRIAEQESLEIVISGSAGGSSWKQVCVFPKKYYCGTYTQALDLSPHPEVRFLRAEWKMSRWGVKEPTPLFGFSLAAEELKLQAVGA